MGRTVMECNDCTAPQCAAMPSFFFLRERPLLTLRVFPEAATPIPEQGTRTQDEEDGSLPRHSLAGTQAASPGPDPPYPLHRPPNGNGSAGGAKPLPPLPRSVLRDNLRHASTRQPAEQPTAAYIHQAHTSSPTELPGGVPIRAKGLLLLQGSASEGLLSCSGPLD